MSTTRWPRGSAIGRLGADRGRDALLDQLHLAGAGRLAGLLDGALLDLGDAGGHAHHDPRVREAALLRLADEVAEHLLGHLEVRDHALPQRPGGGDRRRGAADHALGLGADGVHRAGVGVDRDDRGLGEHDAAAAHVDERVGGPEVDREVAVAAAGERGEESHRAVSVAQRGVVAHRRIAAIIAARLETLLRRKAATVRASLRGSAHQGRQVPSGTHALQTAATGGCSESTQPTNCPSTTTSKRRPEKLVERAFDAFTRRDLEAFLEMAHADVEVMLPTAEIANEGRPYVGHEGIRDYFRDVAEVWEELRVIPQLVAVRGRRDRRDRARLRARRDGDHRHAGGLGRAPDRGPGALAARLLEPPGGARTRAASPRTTCGRSEPVASCAAAFRSARASSRARCRSRAPSAAIRRPAGGCAAGRSRAPR